MNDNAKKWVEALRSGKYKQTTEALHDENGYCCLGVACELYQQEVGDLEIEHEEVMNPQDHRKIHKATFYNNEWQNLPPVVMDWLGLRDDTGSYEVKIEPQDALSYREVRDESLAAKNDEGSSFSEIADIIESEPTGLFVQ